jgi:hypothetical protein
MFSVVFLLVHIRFKLIFYVDYFDKRVVKGKERGGVPGGLVYT